MTNHTSSVQERMRQNAATNHPRLAALGRTTIPAINCTSCGQTESSVFWTVVRDTGDTLHLRCPVCESFEVRYDLLKNLILPSRNRSWMLLAAASLVAVSVGAGIGAGVGSASLEPTSFDTGRAWMDARAGKAVQLAFGHREEVIYLAPGDRQVEVDRLRAEVADRYGIREAGLLRSVRHLGGFDQTRLILAHDSRGWRTRLAACGWERTGSQSQRSPGSQRSNPTC